jgi:hypothetical protein
MPVERPATAQAALHRGQARKSGGVGSAVWRTAGALFFLTCVYAQVGTQSKALLSLGTSNDTELEKLKKQLQSVMDGVKLYVGSFDLCVCSGRGILITEPSCPIMEFV